MVIHPGLEPGRRVQDRDPHVTQDRHGYPVGQTQKQPEGLVIRPIPGNRKEIERRDGGQKQRPQTQPGRPSV